MKLFIFGTHGRMSKVIRELALKTPEIQLLEAPESHCSLIDFTSPDGFDAHLEIAKKNNASYMVGTTGLSQRQSDDLRHAKTQIPVLWASNTSLGANLLFELSHLASQALPNFKVAIEDIHHIHKKDAPSGTALSLQSAIGRPCEITSNRVGETAGIHEVLFTSPFETVSLKHEVSDRKVFAEGALLASLFLSKQKPGLYSMKDVLGFSK